MPAYCTYGRYKTNIKCLYYICTVKIEGGHGTWAYNIHYNVLLIKIQRGCLEIIEVYIHLSDAFLTNIPWDSVVLHVIVDLILIFFNKKLERKKRHKKNVPKRRTKNKKRRIQKRNDITYHVESNKE